MSTDRQASTSTTHAHFEPAMYTEEELLFFLAHLGESPVVACHMGLPTHVNRSAVEDVLGRVHTFEQLRQTYEGESGYVPWAGMEAVRESITRYLDWMGRCSAMHARGGPRHASLLAWDPDGRGIKGAEGSDASIVRTAIMAGNERVRLGIRIGDADSAIAPATFVPDFAVVTQMPTELEIDRAKGTMACPLCHWTANFKPKNMSAYNAARARMARHLKKPSDQLNRHRRLYNAIFSSSRTAVVSELAS
jgi:hypothetical protein